MRGDSTKYNAALILQNVLENNHGNKQLALEELSLFTAELLAESSNGYARHCGPLYEDYQARTPQPPPIRVEDNRSGS